VTEFASDHPINVRITADTKDDNSKQFDEIDIYPKKVTIECLEISC